MSQRFIGGTPELADRCGRMANRVSFNVLAGNVRFKVMTVDEGKMTAVICRSPLELVRVLIKMGIKQTGVTDNPRLCPELQGQPTFSKLIGPMWDGPGMIRYETAEVYAILSQ